MFGHRCAVRLGHRSLLLGASVAIAGCVSANPQFEGGTSSSSDSEDRQGHGTSEASTGELSRTGGGEAASGEASTGGHASTAGEDADPSGIGIHGGTLFPDADGSGDTGSSDDVGIEGADWTEPDCAARVAIDMDSRNWSGALRDVPLNLELDGLRIDLSGAAARGAHLRIVDASDGTRVAHEIESWQPNATSQLWFKATQIDAQVQATTHYMYFECTEPVGIDAGAVWAGLYDGVWHLDGALKDSGPFDWQGYEHGSSTTSSGRFAGGRYYDGVEDHTHLTDLADLRNIESAAMWVQIHSLSDLPGGNVLLSVGGDSEWSSDNFQFRFSVEYDLRLYLFWEHGDGQNVEEGMSETAATIGGSSWHHLAVVRNSKTQSVQFYVDGVPFGAALPVNTPPEGGSTSSLWLGAAQSDLHRDFHGIIDEVRVSRSPWSAARVAADYRGSLPSLLSLGSVERS